MHSEVEDVQPRFVQLVDHETDNAVFVLGDHADAVTLPETTNEVLFRPRELETAIFNFEYFGHVTPNHPTDVNPNFLFLAGTHLGLLPCKSRSATLAASAAAGIPSPGRPSCDKPILACFSAPGDRGGRPFRSASHSMGVVR